MLVPAKSIWKSKTFWLGVLTLLISFLEGVVNLIDLTGTEYAWITGAVGAIVILLRYVTKQPVTVTGKDSKHVDSQNVI